MPPAGRLTLLIQPLLALLGLIARFGFGRARIEAAMAMEQAALMQALAEQFDALFAAWKAGKLTPAPEVVPVPAPEAAPARPAAAPRIRLRSAAPRWRAPRRPVSAPPRRGVSCKRPFLRPARPAGHRLKTRQAALPRLDEWSG